MRPDECPRVSSAALVARPLVGRGLAPDARASGIDFLAFRAQTDRPAPARFNHYGSTRRRSAAGQRHRRIAEHR